MPVRDLQSLQLISQPSLCPRIQSASRLFYSEAGAVCVDYVSETRAAPSAGLIQIIRGSLRVVSVWTL